MIVYPAMDLIDGGPVRLAQGRFDAVTNYEGDPADTLRAFAGAGARWAHVVDLDGARAGAPRQHDLLAALASSAPLQLQVAGGVRSRDHVARLLDAGAGRVVVGSLTVREPETVAAMLSEFGADRLTLALDVSIVDGVPMVATHGWSEVSTLSLWDVADMYEGRHLLVTDIARDGMLTGPSLDLIRQCAQVLPGWDVQASGGVARLADFAALRAAGSAGVIVGKALWESRFTLAEALEHARA